MSTQVGESHEPAPTDGSLDQVGVGMLRRCALPVVLLRAAPFDQQDGHVVVCASSWWSMIERVKRRSVSEASRPEAVARMMQSLKCSSPNRGPFASRASVTPSVYRRTLSPGSAPFGGPPARCRRVWRAFPAEAWRGAPARDRAPPGHG